MADNPLSKSSAGALITQGDAGERMQVDAPVQPTSTTSLNHPFDSAEVVYSVEWEEVPRMVNSKYDPDNLYNQSLMVTEKRFEDHYKEGKHFKDHHKDDNAFKLASYNILAQSYHHRKDGNAKYDYAKPFMGVAGTVEQPMIEVSRCQELLRKIKAIDADVICLQELESESPFLKIVSESYQVHYAARPQSEKVNATSRSSWAPNNDTNKNPDKVVGNATLIRRASRFEFLCNIPIDLNVIQHPHDTTRDPVPVPSYKSLDNVAQLIYLRDNKANRLIALANIHCHWNDKHAETKTLQVKNTWGTLKSYTPLVIQKYFALDNPPHVYYFFVGDFNTRAKDISPFYVHRISDWPFVSVYDRLRSDGPFALPKPTCVGPEFTDCIDYIFYAPHFSSDPFLPRSLADPFSLTSPSQPCTILTHRLLVPYTGPDGQGYLPNESQPSDHYPIGARFLLY